MVTRREMLAAGAGALGAVAAGLTLPQMAEQLKATSILVPLDNVTCLGGSEYTLTLHGHTTKPLRFEHSAFEIAKALADATGQRFIVTQGKHSTDISLADDSPAPRPAPAGRIKIDMGHPQVTVSTKQLDIKRDTPPYLEPAALNADGRIVPLAELPAGLYDGGRFGDCVSP